MVIITLSVSLDVTNYVCTSCFYFEREILLFRYFAGNSTALMVKAHAQLGVPAGAADRARHGKNQ